VKKYLKANEESYQKCGTCGMSNDS